MLKSSAVEWVGVLPDTILNCPEARRLSAGKNGCSDSEKMSVLAAARIAHLP